MSYVEMSGKNETIGKWQKKKGCMKERREECRGYDEEREGIAFGITHHMPSRVSIIL